MRAAATQWQANEFHKENHTPLKKFPTNGPRAVTPRSPMLAARFDSRAPSVPLSATSKQPHHPFGAGSLTSGAKRIPTPTRSSGASAGNNPTPTDLLATGGMIYGRSSAMSPRSSPSLGGPMRVPVSPDTPSTISYPTTGQKEMHFTPAAGGQFEANNKKLPWETSSLKVGVQLQPSSPSSAKSPRPRSPRLGSPRAAASANTASGKATSPRANKNTTSATKAPLSSATKALAVAAPSGKVIAAKVMANVTAARSPPPAAPIIAASVPAAAPAPKLASPALRTTATTGNSSATVAGQSPTKSWPGIAPSTSAKKRPSNKHAFFHAAMVSPTDFRSPSSNPSAPTTAPSPEMSFMRSTASSRASSYTAMLAAADGPTSAPITASTAAGAGASMQSPVRAKKSPSGKTGGHSPVKSPKSNAKARTNPAAARLAPPSPSPPSPVAPAIASSFGANVITPSPEQQVHERYTGAAASSSSAVAAFTSPVSNPAAALAGVLNDEANGEAAAETAPVTQRAQALVENQPPQHEEDSSHSPPLPAPPSTTSASGAPIIKRLPFRTSPFGHSRSTAAPAAGFNNDDVRDEGSISPISKLRPPRTASTPFAAPSAASPAPFAAKASPYRCKPSPSPNQRGSSTSAPASSLSRPNVAAAIATMSPARLPPPASSSSSSNRAEEVEGPLVPSPLRPANLHAASSLDASAEGTFNTSSMAELPSPPKGPGRGPNGSMQSSRPEVTNPVARFLLEAEWDEVTEGNSATAIPAHALGTSAADIVAAPASASDEPPSPLPFINSTILSNSGGGVFGGGSGSAAAELSRIALLRTNSSASNLSATSWQDPGSGVLSPSSSMQSPSSSSSSTTAHALLNEGFCLSATGGGSSGGVLSRQSSNATGFSQLLARSFDDDTQDASDAAYPTPALSMMMTTMADSSSAVSPLASPPSTFGAFGPFVAQRKPPLVVDEGAATRAYAAPAPVVAPPAPSQSSPVSSFSATTTDAYEALAWAEVWAPVNDSAFSSSHPPRCLSVNPQNTKVIEGPLHRPRPSPRFMK